MVITVSTVTRRAITRTGSLSLNSPTSPTSAANHCPRAGSIQDTATTISVEPVASSSTLDPTFDSSIFMSKEGDHSYQAPSRDASRSPCPALNALANHGYLPRDGHGISFHKIVDSLEKGFGLSHGFAIFMAIGTFTLLRRPSLRPFDLAGTNRHGFIEHNASLSRDDSPSFWEFGHSRINLTRLQEFLNKAHPTPTSHGEDVFTAHDIAAHRLELEKRAPLHGFYSEIARAEFAMVMEIFGHGKDHEVAEKAVEVLIKGERFPDGWKPTHTVHLRDTAARSKEIRLTMATMQKTMEERERSAEEDGVIAHVFDQLMRLVGKND